MKSRVRSRPLLLLLATVASTTILAACGGDDPTLAGSGNDSAVSQDRGAALEHIHGLGAGEDGRLFIAAHNGLFSAAEGETTPSQVSEHSQDIMGFSLIDEDRFIGSGHPAPDQDLPPHLGLIESRDGGKTWKSVSLLGEADFHALESAGKKVYGYDGLSGRLMVSSDGGRTWQSRTPPTGIFDLAVDPRNNSRVVASSEQGLLISQDAGASWRRLPPDAPGLVAWSTTDDELYLIDGGGTVLVSEDAGRKWRNRGNVGGQPVAFIASGPDLYAALADGTVMHSDDGGDGWTVRIEAA